MAETTECMYACRVGGRVSYLVNVIGYIFTESGLYLLGYAHRKDTYRLQYRHIMVNCIQY
jgi:hypothetical protein